MASIVNYIFLLYCVFSTQKLFVESVIWLDLGDGGALPTLKECGKVRLSNRIFGGTDTEIDEFPWTALLIFKNQTNDYLGATCMGSLINKYFVLTAARCVVAKNDLKLVAVRLGEWNLATKIDCEYDEKGQKTLCAPPYQDVDVQEVTIHPEFVEKTMSNDIALIRLVHHVDYNDFVSPICLPMQTGQPHLGYTKTAVQIAGWGETEDGGRSKLKRKATVRIIPLTHCVHEINLDGVGFGYKYASFLQVCAQKNDIHACKLDGGGPLMHKDVQRKMVNYYLIGVFSSNEYTCTQRDSPAIYTRVYPYLSWIKQTINK